ncbi:hypothetical protein G7046_g8814 [Stylonectria norvegica]|nr:hypothetical protein G7046_g8814 [Stylonectria norvegica]
MSTDAFQHFGLSCPNGGRFFICQDSAVEFIGCCTSDPCADKKGVCPDEDLRTSSFNTDSYDDLAPQACDDPRGNDIWFTCKFNTPPFLGCCDSNPCANGSCPQTDLVPAKLSGDKTARMAFLNPEGTASATSSATKSATASASTSAASDDDGGLGTGAIAGIAVAAGVVGLCILAGLIWRLCWVPRKRRQNQGQPVPLNSPGLVHQGTMGMAQSPHQQTPQMSPYQDSFASSPGAPAYYPSTISSNDAYAKHLSPNGNQSQFDRPVSMSTFSDVSSGNGYNRVTQQQYPGPQMHVVQELDGTSAPIEMDGGGGGDVHHDRKSQSWRQINLKIDRTATYFLTIIHPGRIGFEEQPTNQIAPATGYLTYAPSPPQRQEPARGGAVAPSAAHCHRPGSRLPPKPPAKSPTPSTAKRVSKPTRDPFPNQAPLQTLLIAAFLFFGGGALSSSSSSSGGI